MKKVLHVIDTGGPGGAETVFVELADRLRKRGFASLTVAGKGGWVEQELTRRGLMFRPLDSKGSLNWRFLKGLVDIVRQENVDLIQSHLLGANVYCGMTGAITRRPVVATFHGTVDVSPNERLRWLKLMAMRSGVERFVAVSNNLREQIRNQGLLEEDKSQVIYNGIESCRYGRGTLTDLRVELGLSAESFLIGCLGNVRPAKGYGVLIEAALALRNRRKNVHILVAGDMHAGLMAELRAQLATSGLSSRVHFIGFVEDSGRFLGQLDMFVLSSLSEGFSIATVEAMATGLPVVVTRCGGPEEIVTDGADGIVVPARDPHALATAIDRLVDDEGLREQLGRRASESARRRFDIDHTIGEYAALYERLLPR